MLIIAGLVIASNYIEYRQLLIGTISLHVPLFVCVFTRPDIASEALSIFFKYSWFPFLLLFFPRLGFTQMYTQPILILVCFASLYNRRVAFWIIVVGLLYATKDIFEERGPFIKGCVAFLISICIMIRHRLSSKIIRIGHVLGYLSSVFLFVFIFSDLFTAFLGSSDASDAISNNKSREDRYKDTRSLLYIDAINSSIQHGYYLFGHTPARGFEASYSSELFMTENTELNKGERHKNEMVLANIYTWEGLVGLFIYTLIYMRGSYLAVYRSKNKIVPLIGCFVAWRWSWGWVEDVNNFMLTDIDLWFFIAICYSSYFRNMSEENLILWARSILNKSIRLTNSQRGIFFDEKTI